MGDKSWMMNTKAISAAKTCVSIVEQELGIRLKLANPDFLELLIQYAELNDSKELERAVLKLAQFAPVNIDVSLEIGSAKAKSESNSTVTYRGKNYPRFMDGGEFKGMYRGQPRYA